MPALTGFHERIIHLPSIRAAEEFVAAAGKCDFPVLIHKVQEEGQVDGKSFLGVLSILGRENLDVSYCGDNCELAQVLDKYRTA